MRRKQISFCVKLIKLPISFVISSPFDTTRGKIGAEEIQELIQALCSSRGSLSLLDRSRVRGEPLSSRRVSIQTALQR